MSDSEFIFEPDDGEVYSDLELRVFLENGTKMNQGEVEKFLRDLKNFWTEADCINDFFNDVYNAKAKPIPYED